eukprot:1933775-Rhodomonas_salina.1
MFDDRGHHDGYVNVDDTALEPEYTDPEKPELRDGGVLSDSEEEDSVLIENPFKIENAQDLKQRILMLQQKYKLGKGGYTFHDHLSAAITKPLLAIENGIPKETTLTYVPSLEYATGAD